MGQYICKHSWIGGKECKILMHGLDAAGKTTILYRLKLGEVVTTIPTIGFNVESVKHKNLNLLTWDIGGRDKIRPLYRHYYPNTAALMFIIDSGDRERLEEISDEMRRILDEDELRETVFLILANKQDLESAMTVDEIREQIGFDKMFNSKHPRRANIFGCSAITEEGIVDLYKALDWLCNELSPAGTSWLAWSSGKDKHVVKDKPETKNNDKNSEECSNSKTPWSLGAYIKGSMSALKSVLPGMS